MQNKTVKLVGAVLLGVIAVWRIIAMFNPPTAPREAFETYQKLGTLAAQETAKLLGRGAEVVLVVPAQVSNHVKSGENTFLKTAAAQGLSVSQVLRAPESAWHSEQGMSASYYEQVMQQAAGAAAVVSYVGIPNMEVLRSGSGDSKRPAFVAVLPNMYYLPEMMKTGRVQLAVVPGAPPLDFQAVLPDPANTSAGDLEPSLQEEPEFIDDLLTPR